MNFRNHLRKVMLTYPSLFPAPICVYDQLFLTIGNGYEWKDGELVCNDENSLCDTVEEAVNRIKDDYFKRIEDIYGISEDVFTGIIERYKKEVENYLYNIFHIEDIMEDLTVPEFKFYSLSKYSAIANIPDDVHYDWIKAIKDFVDILDENKDKFKDSENLFDGIKERVNSLFAKRVEDYVKQLG